jgi:hypothetical protein
MVFMVVNKEKKGGDKGAGDLYYILTSFSHGQPSVKYYRKALDFVQMFSNRQIVS